MTVASDKRTKLKKKTRILQHVNSRILFFTIELFDNQIRIRN